MCPVMLYIRSKRLNSICLYSFQSVMLRRAAPLSMAARATAADISVASLVSLYFGNNGPLLLSAANDVRLLVAAPIIALFMLVDRVSSAPLKR